MSKGEGHFEGCGRKTLKPFLVLKMEAKKVKNDKWRTYKVN